MALASVASYKCKVVGLWIGLATRVSSDAKSNPSLEGAGGPAGLAPCKGCNLTPSWDKEVIVMRIQEERRMNCGSS